MEFALRILRFGCWFWILGFGCWEGGGALGRTGRLCMSRTGVEDVTHTDKQDCLSVLRLENVIDRPPMQHRS